MLGAGKGLNLKQRGMHSGVGYGLVSTRPPACIRATQDGLKATVFPPSALGILVPRVFCPTGYI